VPAPLKYPLHAFATITLSRLYPFVGQFDRARYMLARLVVQVVETFV